VHSSQQYPLQQTLCNDDDNSLHPVAAVQGLLSGLQLISAPSNTVSCRGEYSHL